MKLWRFFDHIEDWTRMALSRRPILYALVGGIGFTLFWRGIWMIADSFGFLTGPVSAILGLCILLLSGLFVSLFVGDSIILSGVRKEKKIIEKTEAEIRAEANVLAEIHREVKTIRTRFDQLEKKQRAGAGKQVKQVA